MESYWIRDTRRKRNKWHRVVRIYTDRGAFDAIPCGLQVGPAQIDDELLANFPGYQAPDDEFGVCLHCLRSEEMQHRIAEKSRRITNA